jgi:hypothetical protein
MEFPPEIEEIIDQYTYEPPAPPPAPIRCYTHYLNYIGRYDKYLRFLPLDCKEFANPMSYIEYNYESKICSGHAKTSGFCNDCKNIILTEMFEDCQPCNYNEQKEFITSIKVDGVFMYKRNSFIQILKRVLHFFIYYNYIPVLPISTTIVCTIDNIINPIYATFPFIVTIYCIYKFIKYC